MNRLFALFITFFFLNNCSFNENSRIWKDKEKDLSEKENVKKIFAEEEVKASEFNQEVKLNLSGLRTSNKIIDNTNNYGAQIYDGVFKKIGSFKFSKLDEINNIVDAIMPNITSDLGQKICVYVQGDLRKLKKLHAIYKSNKDILTEEMIQHTFKQKAYNEDIKKIILKLLNDPYDMSQHIVTYHDVS